MQVRQVAGRGSEAISVRERAVFNGECAVEANSSVPVRC